MKNSELKQTAQEIEDYIAFQYNGTPLEGLDAFERQLKRFGIEVPTSDKCSLEALTRKEIRE